MNSDIVGGIIMIFFIGVFSGLCFAWFLTSRDDSQWLYKSDVEHHRTVTSEKYFVQYSAVRRFPR